jgi:hypothetical protein
VDTDAVGYTVFTSGRGSYSPTAFLVNKKVWCFHNFSGRNENIEVYIHTTGKEPALPTNGTEIDFRHWVGGIRLLSFCGVFTRTYPNRHKKLMEMRSWSQWWISWYCDGFSQSIKLWSQKTPLIVLLVGWDWVHLVLRPLLAEYFGFPCQSSFHQFLHNHHHYHLGLVQSEKTCPSATLSTTNSTWADPDSNPGRRGGKPAINRVSYGSALHRWWVNTLKHMRDQKYRGGVLYVFRA